MAWQLGLFTSLLLILTGGVVSWGGYEVARQIIRDQIHTRLKTVALDRTRAIREYVDRQSERVVLVASRTQLRRLVHQYERGLIAADVMRRDTGRILGDAKASTADFLSISWVGVDGRVLSSTEEALLGTEVGHVPAVAYCLAAQDKSVTYLGEPHQEADRVFAYLAAPATIEERLLGAVLIQLDVRDLQAIVLSTEPQYRFGDTGEVLVARRDSDRLRYLFAEQQERFGNTAPHATPGMQEAVAGQDGFAIGDFAGEGILLYHTPMPELTGDARWGLVAKLDIEEAYVPLAWLRATLVALQLCLLVVGLTASFFLAGRWTRPIEQLRDAAQCLAEGDLSRRVDGQRSDELGTLAAAFNQMAGSLSELNSQLEQKVAERTRELAEARDAAEAAHHELVAKTQELERSNSDLQQFAYVASHDLQEPLRAVTGFTELLKSRYGDQLDEEAHQFIDYAVDGAKRMSTLIHNLLEYSRLGVTQQYQETISLGDAVSDATRNLRVAIEEAQATIDVGSLPQVLGDRGQLARVFQNLLGNALKFRGSEPLVVRVRAERRDDAFWQVVVEDNGIGFQQEHADRLFLVFQRLHSRSKYPGTGIGLAICQRIIQQHGGEIRGEGEPGGGARFTFTLPAGAVAADAPDQLADAPTS